MVVCTAEDRAEALIGLKVLALSLARHCPGVELHAFAPSFPTAFIRWAEGQRAVRLHAARPEWRTSWSIKPDVLLDRLDAGHDSVVWMDADVVLTRDVQEAWSRFPPQDLLVASEPRWPEGGDGSELRTLGLGELVGRRFDRAINSSVVRVAPAHRPLLAAWRERLSEPSYLDAQSRPIAERPRHLVGDQDALAGLIGSARFADVPVSLLEPPRDILHAAWSTYSSYPVSHRLRHAINGLPVVVHALGGPKPWEAASAARLSAGLSAYCAVASAYGDAVGELAQWMRPMSAIGRASDAIAFGHPAFRDLLATLAVSIRRWIE